MCRCWIGRLMRPRTRRRKTDSRRAGTALPSSSRVSWAEQRAPPPPGPRGCFIFVYFFFSILFIPDGTCDDLPPSEAFYSGSGFIFWGVGGGRWQITGQLFTYITYVFESFLASPASARWRNSTGATYGADLRAARLDPMTPLVHSWNITWAVWAEAEDTL